MKGTAQERLEVRYGTPSSAQLILEVAKAASSHLELSEVLESLIVALKPTSRFDAISVFVIEGEYTRLHSLHVERVGRRPGDPWKASLRVRRPRSMCRSSPFSGSGFASTTS